MAHELPPRTELNHSSVAPDVVHTSRVGPAARYRGIRAVSTTERKRRVEGGSAMVWAFCDAEIEISTQCVRG